jgi:co-chaperonin GroES (HSP10)
MKPLRDEVVIKQQSRENKTEAGIILTTDVAIKENVGEVVALGSKAEELEIQDL